MLDTQGLVDFLNVYISYPCLWNPKDAGYSDKKTKNAAYDVLLNVMQRMDERVDMITMKKKIENVRATAKREWKKVQASRRAATSEEDVYKPRLFYYDVVKIIYDVKDGDSEMDFTTEGEGCSYSKEQDDSFIEPEDNERIDDLETEAEHLEEPESPKPKAKTSKRKRKFKKEEPSFQYVSSSPPPPELEEELDEELDDQHVADHDEVLEVSEDVGDDDEVMSFGRTLGLQLQSLDEAQRHIAENIISNVIFQARMSKLTPNSKISSSESYL